MGEPAFDDTCRNSRHYAVRRDILANYTSGSYHRPFSNGNTGENYAIGSYPAIILNHNCFSFYALAFNGVFC
jgi:hypothetical protein